MAKRDGSVDDATPGISNKTVDTSTGPCEVIVDVAERVGVEPKYSAYNMAHEGSAGYTKRLTYDAKENGVISVSSGHSAGEISPALYGFPNLIMRDDAVLDVSNIPPVCEVVNIRFAERV